MARGFDKASSSSCGSVGCNRAVGPRDVVGPHNHAPAVACLRGIGLEQGVGANIDHLRIGQLRVLALVVAADPDRAACVGARHIDLRPVRNSHPVTQHINSPAPGSGGRNLSGAFHIRITSGLEHHLAAVQTGGGGLYLAAVAQRAGKDAHRIALQPAQVAHLIARGLYQQRDAFKSAPGDLHLLAGCEDGAAIGRLHQCAGAHVDIRCDQHHVAIACSDATAHRDATRTSHAGIHITKPQPTGQRIGIAHAQSRSGEAGGVYDRPGAHGNAGLVDQHQAAVGGQITKQGRGGVGNDAIDGGAGGAGLHKGGAGAGRDGETLPVDGRMAGAGAVLGGDLELVGGRVADGRLAMNGYTAGGQGLSQGRARLGCKPSGQCQRQHSRLECPMPARGSRGPHRRTGGCNTRWMRHVLLHEPTCL